MRNVPDESIDFFYRVLNLIIGIGRFYPQFEDQSVELVYNERDLDTLLESVSDDFFRTHHDLLGKECHSISSGERSVASVNRPLRERPRRAEYRQPT